MSCLGVEQLEPDFVTGRAGVTKRAVAEYALCVLFFEGWWLRARGNVFPVPTRERTEYNLVSKLQR